MTLTTSVEKFAESWGGMAIRLNLNRKVAEIHALSYLCAAPLNTEDVAQALSFSCSTVSANLKELEVRGLIIFVAIAKGITNQTQAHGRYFKLFWMIATGG